METSNRITSFFFLSGTHSKNHQLRVKVLLKRRLCKKPHIMVTNGRSQHPPPISVFISLDVSQHLQLLVQQWLWTAYWQSLWSSCLASLLVRTLLLWARLLIRILSPISELQRSCRGRSTIFGLSFHPRIPPSLPIILSTTRPSFHSAFFFVSLFNNTTAPVSGIFGLSAVKLDFLSPRAWAYSSKNLLRKYPLLLCKNFIRLDTFSSPIVSRSSSTSRVGFPLS